MHRWLANAAVASAPAHEYAAGMLFALGAALACEPSLMGQFPVPAAPPPKLTVETTSGKYAENTYTGAQVTMRSASPVPAWTAVLEHPERQDEWHPKELGTERVERVEGTDFFQRTAISVLGFTVRRQVIARVHWLESTVDRLHTCWSAGVPAEFARRVQAWDDGSTWQEHGFGGWTITGLPGGGSAVSYQVWVDTNGIPAPLVAWGVSRTLPTLLGAFEAHVAELYAASGAAPAAPTGAVAAP